MKWVQPKVFLIAKTQVDKGVVMKWLLSIGAEDYNLPSRPGTSDAEILTIIGGKRCYNAFVPGVNANVSKVRENPAEYLDNILASGHGSVLEHSSFTFAIENVSRVFTGEMNRHRAGMAISEQSMRFVRFDDIALVETPLLRDTDNPDIRAIRRDMESAARSAEAAYRNIMDQVGVGELEKFKEKKVWTSLARRIAPMGVATGGVWTGNVRALRHILTMRCAPAAEEEIREIAGIILEKMIQDSPLLFGDFTPGVGGSWIPKYMKV